MIKGLRVTTDIYNLDCTIPTSTWPAFEIKPTHSPTKENSNREFAELAKSQSNHPPFMLDYKDTLPEGADLDLRNAGLVFVQGENGIGKTTLLKGIARSVANAQHYLHYGRTRLFYGNLGFPGAIEPEIGLFLCCDPFARFHAPGNHNYSFLIFGSGVETSQKLQAHLALFFYSGREEIFDKPLFIGYAKADPQHISNQFGALFHSGLTERSIDSSLRDLVGVRFDDIPKELENNQALRQIMGRVKQVDEDQFKRRMVFLTECSSAITCAYLPINIFGQYELDVEEDVLRNLVVLVYDSLNQSEKDHRSKGKYMKATLEEYITTITADSRHYLVLLDEPTGNTDDTTSNWFVSKFLPSLQQQGDRVQVMVATKDQSLRRKARDLDSKVIQMEQNGTRIIT